MKRTMLFVGIFIYASLTGFTQIDKSESCYLFIKDTYNSVPDVFLESTQVNVKIDGVIANVCVKQKYVNKGKEKLEALYIFPGSTRAAVYGMTMQIGKHKIVAEVKEKQKARDEYEKAKKDGKNTSLLEQHRPNVFQMNIANILPGDTVAIEMKYTELLEYSNNIYEFVYPGIVGPRYDTSGERWALQTNLEHYTGLFDINIEIMAGMPISSIKSTSHEIGVTNFNNSVNVKPSNPKGYDSKKDFILYYGLQGNKVQSGLITYKHDDENFFLLMVQPPKKTDINEIAPREYIFIVDVSGSMYGFPLTISKKILRNLISSLRPTDLFNVMLFESSNAMMSEQSLPATSENIEKAIRIIEKSRGGGGTQLYPALKNAFDFKTTPDFARTFIVATDGYVTVETEAFELTRQNRNNANLFMLGIGGSVNRYLIEGMAYAGGGQAYIINNETEAEEVGKRLIKDISTPVLSHIEIDWNPSNNVYEVTPHPVSDLFETKPVIVYGKYKGKLSGDITITGTTGNGSFTQKVNTAKAEKAKSPALRYLWARDKIKYLSDYAGYFDTTYKYSYRNEISETQRELIISLGLKYNLMTAYTSFIATDNQLADYPIEEGIKFVESDFEDMPAVMQYQPLYVEEEIVEEIIPFSIAETPAIFMGSNNIADFAKWVQLQLKYPEPAATNGIQGRVIVQFTVDVDGSIKDIQILRSIDPLLDNEAIRVIKSAPKWVPAHQRNKPVAVSYTIPVIFQLN